MIETIRALEAASRVLDPDAAERARLRAAFEPLTEGFLGRARTMKAFVDEPERAFEVDVHPIAAEGRPIESIVELLENAVVTPSAQPASPGHVAYFTGGGLYHGALADFASAITNKYTGIYFPGPGEVRIENQVVRWIADLVGYPAEAGGAVLSGGSIAILTAVVAAREAAGLRAADIPSAVVYLTAQTHHALGKALRVAGLSEAQLRIIPIDERYRMRPDALAEAIATDRAQGLRPWLITATAGTTEVGAVDPLAAIADIAEREHCWFHVDAAYGGFFLLTEHGRAMMRGIERSDSVILDPHKGLFAAWGVGVVLTRDATTLTTAMRDTGPYLQDTGHADVLSPADVSPELTRPFRALRLWLPLAHLGTRPFVAALEEKLELARYFYTRVQELGFEVGPEPDLGVIVFRWPADSADADDLEKANAINQRLRDQLLADGRIFLSTTMLDGRFTLRIAPLSFRTHLDTVDLVLDVLDELTAPLRR
ncbi:MAG: aminotransferase class V-fold PLP-dependent enzyme [Acidobacteriota bacterium]